MPLKIHNSLTGQKEEFKPIMAGQVKMYVCGPTVYDEPHIGHLRSAYVFDVMRRYLEFSGYQVTFVRNVTDVDDKIIDKAVQNGVADLVAEVKNVSEEYFKAYKNDLQALGIQEPTKEPRATAHIDDMVWLIQKLLKNGRAYESQGDVYFDVTAAKDYGKLSHQKKDQMLENVRIDANERKKGPLDFALWKKSKEGEPAWDSPWGKGRPGWHIECSAMSMKYLGETFDIHGGGRDLIFPHHENEIAQSEGVTNARFANFWVHHGLITVNEQKMSKSLKNFVTLTAVQKQSAHGKEELKLLFLGTHYSAPLDYSEEPMKMAQGNRKRFYYFFDEALQLRKEGFSADLAYAKNFDGLFRDSMDDDFNVPGALSVIHAMMRDARKSNKPENILAAAGAIQKIMERVFGLNFEDADTPEKRSTQKVVDEAIQKRSLAKQKKDYKAADEIRDTLLRETGIELVDLIGGKTIGRMKL